MLHSWPLALPHNCLHPSARTPLHRSKRDHLWRLCLSLPRCRRSPGAGQWGGKLGSRIWVAEAPRQPVSVVLLLWVSSCSAASIHDSAAKTSGSSCHYSAKHVGFIRSPSCPSPGSYGCSLIPARLMGVYSFRAYKSLFPLLLSCSPMRVHI